MSPAKRDPRKAGTARDGSGQLKANNPQDHTLKRDDKVTTDGGGETASPRGKSRRSAIQPKNARVTIRDVARRARVSPATVSNVLNDRSGVGEPTRQRVRKVIEDMGFIRSTAAHQLRGGRSSVIGLVVFDVLNPFYGELLHGAESVLRQEGYALMVCSTGESRDTERHYLRLLQEHRVDGVLITPVQRNLGGITAIVEQGIPTVLVDRGASDRTFCSVTVDHVRAGELAVNHLLELGHSHIAFLNGPSSVRQYSDLARGARRAARGWAHDAEPQIIELSVEVPSADSGENMIDQVLSVKPRPTAIMCVSDLLALGALRGLHRARLRVPEDMSLVGYDDVAFASMLSPPLTSVRQPKYELGVAAAQLLLEELRNPNHEHRGIRFEPELIARTSSAPPMGLIREADR